LKKLEAEGKNRNILGYFEIASCIAVIMNMIGITGLN